MNLSRRVGALEQANPDEGHEGYAVVTLYDGETLEEAQQQWIADNGPLGRRQWVVYGLQ